MARKQGIHCEVYKGKTKRSGQWSNAGLEGLTEDANHLYTQRLANSGFTAAIGRPLISETLTDSIKMLLKPYGQSSTPIVPYIARGFHYKQQVLGKLAAGSGPERIAIAAGDELSLSDVLGLGKLERNLSGFTISSVGIFIQPPQKRDASGIRPQRSHLDMSLEGDNVDTVLRENSLLVAAFADKGQFAVQIPEQVVVQLHHKATPHTDLELLMGALHQVRDIAMGSDVSLGPVMSR